MRARTRHWGTPKTARRHGAVLLIVLVVVMMMALGAYAFSEFMVTEAESVLVYGRMVQTRVAADAGIEMAAAMVGDRTNSTPATFYHNPGSFGGVIVRDGAGTLGPLMFSVVAPVEGDDTGSMIRNGLVDESSKLNLNLLIDDEESGAAASAASRLLLIPGMTEDLADAILDFLDEDIDARALGAEDDYYQSLETPYYAKNGKLDSFEELLLVRGMTPDLLFGEDANRNGILDPEENDGDLNPPWDNADGVLDRGLAAYLTLESREQNKRIDGTDRINLNSNNLAELYDTLEEEFDTQVADFVVAYRLFGPYDPSSASTGTGSGSGTGSGTGTGTAGGGGGGGTVAGSTGNAGAVDDFARALGQAVFGTQGDVTRGGMNLTGGAQFPISSIFDLVGIQVQKQTSTASEVLTSPWSADGGEMIEYAPDLFDVFTMTAETVIEGRINVNQASAAVLMTIPGMTEETAAAIVSAQQAGLSSSSLSGRDTPAWLVIEGIVSLETMRSIAPYLTARGDVYRAYVVGHFQGGGPVCRVEVVIDGSQTPPAVVFRRDLNDLGRGYSRSQLAGE